MCIYIILIRYLSVYGSWQIIYICISYISKWFSFVLKRICNYKTMDRFMKFGLPILRIKPEPCSEKTKPNQTERFGLDRISLCFFWFLCSTVLPRAWKFYEVFWLSPFSRLKQTFIASMSLKFSVCGVFISYLHSSALWYNYF